MNEQSNPKVNHQRMVPMHKGLSLSYFEENEQICTLSFFHE